MTTSAQLPPILRPPDGYRWLDQLFILRHQIDAEIDRLFADARLPEGLELTLFNEADAGFGDVAFATRLLDLMAAQAPGLGRTLVSSRPDKQRLFGLPAAVTLHAFDAFEANQGESLIAPSIVVSAPGIFDHARLKPAVMRRLGLVESTPFLYLAEYGSIRQLRDDAFKTRMPDLDLLVERFLDEVASAIGVAAIDMGYRGRSGEVVVADEDDIKQVEHLATVATSERADNPLWSWLTEPVLEARSCGLEKGEVGVLIDEKLVAEVAQLEPLRHGTDRPTRGSDPPRLLARRRRPRRVSGADRAVHGLCLPRPRAICRRRRRPGDRPGAAYRRRGAQRCDGPRHLATHL